eukprot:200033-Chlamydomonas_euryale.AAC.1
MAANCAVVSGPVCVCGGGWCAAATCSRSSVFSACRSAGCLTHEWFCSIFWSYSLTRLLIVASCMRTKGVRGGGSLGGVQFGYRTVTRNW